MPNENFWDRFKENYPITAGALGVAPVTGQLTAGMDYYNAMRDGESAKASLAAMGFIPGFKLAKYGTKLVPPSIRLRSQMNLLEKAIAPLVKDAHLIGQVNNAGDVGEAVAQTYNNYINYRNEKNRAYSRDIPTMARYGENG